MFYIYLFPLSISVWLYPINVLYNYAIIYFANIVNAWQLCQYFNDCRLFMPVRDDKWACVYIYKWNYVND